ncbi:MAG: aldo/keto reductase [Candidatus Brockarchaeota archaeon]|nr:aldo/keto reductase [Candidatus Brockarchaeota archaeon]
MRYKNLGRTGLKVSVLGFGSMRLPMIDGQVDVGKALEVLNKAFDSGINFVDTAVGYCNQQSETTVGKAVKGRRGEIVISTKNPYKGPSGQEWRAILDQSLNRLGVDYIDLYNFHGLTLEQYQNWVGLPRSPIEEALKAKDEGVVRYLGLSCHDKPVNMIKLLDTGIFSSIILQYNILDRVNEGVMEYANSKGIGVVVMGPVGGGRLAAPSDAMMRMIQSKVSSTAELALRFVLSNPSVSSALSGMSTVKMVEENAATASLAEPLSKEEREKISAALEEKKRLADLFCTGCGYCMPCPNGVDIPANFELMNYYRIYGLAEYAREGYKRLGEREKDGKKVPAWAGACKECGECEPRCPRKIEIRAQLKSVRKELG